MVFVTDRAATQKLAYTIPEAVAATGLSRPTLYRLRAAGKLPMCRIGARTVIRREHIEEMLKRAEGEDVLRPEAA